MRTIYLHGHLERFGAKTELHVQTPAEAIRALSINYPGFSEALQEGYYEIVRGSDPETGLALDLEDMSAYRLGNGDLHIIPVAQGAKRGGIVKAILGVALIGVAVFASGGALGAAIGSQGSMLGGLTWGNVAMVGLGLTIAGASQALTKTEGKEDDKSESYSLSGALNSYEQGNPVPLIFGELIVGGQLISAGVDIEQLKVENDDD